MADNPIRHDEIIQPGNPFLDTIKGLEKVIKLLKEAAKDYLKFAEKQNVATKEGRKNLQSVANATSQLSIKEKEALKIKQQLEREQVKSNLANSKEYKELIKTREATKAKNAELRKAAKAQLDGAKSTNTWSKALGSFQFKFNALGNIAANVTSRLTRLFNRAFRDALKVITTFEQSMADVRAITKASDQEFKALSKSARDLGGSTKYTAIEVAKLQKEYAKLGFTTKEILGVSEATLNLAAATGTELPRAAEVVGTTLRQFNLDASQASRVTDVMAKSFTTSALDMERFAEAMKYVGPAAKASGLSVERTTALLGQLANAGIYGSQAGTSLRQIMLSLAKGTGTFTEKLAKATEGNLDLAGATEEVQKRAATSLLVLKQGIDTIDDFTSSLENAKGAAEAMAKVQLNTLQGKITILRSAWERYILSLASSEEQFIYLKAILDGTAAGLNDMADSVEGNKEEATAFNKALHNLWNATKNALPIVGSMKTNVDELKSALIEAQTAAEDAGMAFEEALSKRINPLSIVKVNKAEEKQIETINTLQEQLRDLQEQRDNASISEVAAYNKWIKMIEERIKKYKEAGEARPDVAEIKEWTDEEIELDELSWERKEDNYREYIETRRMLRKRLEKEEEAQRKKEEEEEKDKEKKKQQIIDASFQQATELASTFTSIFAAQKEKELSAVGDNAEKRAEIEKKYAKKEQALTIAQATVDGAAAIVKTWRNMGGFPTALPFVIAQAAATAAQIGIIASQKFAEGGSGLLDNKGGILKGKRHAQGGVNLGEIGEAEKGEYFGIINRQMTQKYGDELPIIFDSLNNGAFHEIWGRLNIKEAPIQKNNPWVKEIHDLLMNTPHEYSHNGKIIRRYPNKTIISG